MSSLAPGNSNGNHGNDGGAAGSSSAAPGSGSGGGIAAEPIGNYGIVSRLGAGGMGAVFRAKHQESGRAVALKIALAADPVAVDSVRREIRLLGRIRHPGVVSLLEHGVHDLRPWYAMELVEGQRLADWIAKLWSRTSPDPASDDADTRPMRGITDADGIGGPPADHRGAPGAEMPVVAAGRLVEVVQLFARLSQTLGYLHGEGIVHLDLKPQNILLRADGQPVLVDFGITRQVAGGLNREVLDVDPLDGGTELYMAPEQIAATATDARTDLYSLGCMLYEALSGWPPFLETIDRSIREHHLKTPPRPPSAWVTGVPPELDEAVMRLLEKRPDKRLGYAGDLLDLLCRIGARVDPELAVRKGKPYLYRPTLIGRAALMEQLSGELARARDGNGRCVFLMGKSGAGKTRVVMELGREAFASGMRVVSGECAPVTLSATPPDAGGGSPLHPFQSMLSTVVDLCNAGGPDVTAALVGDGLPVLENLEPALARVAGRDRFPETLSAVSAYGRTEQALSATIVATAHATPLLLVIDDLQWADSLSLAVIGALAKLPDTSHVCVLVTCRIDELTPDLVELSRAPHAVRYDLEPLSRTDVASIIAGMLANDDAPSDLVQLIGDRADGNPFFVAEYLQAAVSTGQLKRDPLKHWSLGSGTDAALQLPRTPAELLSLRVKDLDDGSREILEMAAVLGRSFSRATLRRARPGLPTDEIEQLVHRGILVEDGPKELRFSHDKLREAGYAGIAADRRRVLHKTAAAEILSEQREESSGAVVAGADGANLPTQLERAALLAHHYREAGMMREQFTWLRTAGDLANRVGAHKQARALLHEALELLREHPDLADLAGDSREQARLWGNYGAVLETLAEVDLGVPALERSLGLLGHRVPAGGPALGAFVVAQLAKQIAQRLRAPSPAVQPGATATTTSTSRDAQAAEVAAALARGYVGINRQLQVIGAVLLSANLAERSDAAGAVVHSHAFLGGIAGLFGMHRLADGYFERARLAAKRDGTLDAALTLAQLEGFHFMSRAEWSRATTALSPVLERALKASALHLAEPPLLMLNYVHMLQGDLVRAGEYIATLLMVAKKTGNERFFLVGSLAEALHDLYRGAFAPALARLESLHERVLAFDEFIHIANFHATRAGLLSWLERHDEAVAFADKSVEILKDTGTRNALLYNVHAFSPETYLRAWARAAADGKDTRSLADRARAAVKASAQFSGVCEYAKPLALRFRGELLLLEGKATAGVRALEESVAVGKMQGNLYEEGMAAMALARGPSASSTSSSAAAAGASPLDARARETWARHAEERFLRLGHHPFVEELASRRAVELA